MDILESINFAQGTRRAIFVLTTNQKNNNFMELTFLQRAQNLINNCKGFNQVKQPKGNLYPCLTSTNFQILSNTSGKKYFVYIFETGNIFEAQF